MNYWLVKTEPETFSWDELERTGVAMWDGVRNFQARNNLRKMKKGDTVFFYYSGKNPGIVGLAEVEKEYYPDPTANGGDWSVVDLKPIRKLDQCVTLNEIKQIPELKNMSLVKNTRLSVQPVQSEDFTRVLTLEVRK